jgi:large subunit ribosomal protein L22
VQQKDGFGGDVDRLYVARCWADQGPSMKRTRPAPMGRAFRVVKRMAHLTVEVAERPRASQAEGSAPRARRTAKAPAE